MFKTRSVLKDKIFVFSAIILISSFLEGCGGSAITLNIQNTDTDVQGDYSDALIAEFQNVEGYESSLQTLQANVDVTDATQATAESAIAPKYSNDSDVMTLVNPYEASNLLEAHALGLTGEGQKMTFFLTPTFYPEDIANDVINIDLETAAASVSTEQTQRATNFVLLSAADKTKRAGNTVDWYGFAPQASVFVKTLDEADLTTDLSTSTLTGDSADSVAIGFVGQYGSYSGDLGYRTSTITGVTSIDSFYDLATDSNADSASTKQELVETLTRTSISSDSAKWNDFITGLTNLGENKIILSEAEQIAPQDGNVVVTSTSTSETRGTITNAVSNVLTAIPLVETSLQDQWISVAAARYAENSDADYSAEALTRCGQAQRFCITAPSFIADENKDVRLRYDQSYAVSTVAGALALLRKAFGPSVTNAQLRQRLFATANQEVPEFSVSAVRSQDWALENTISTEEVTFSSTEGGTTYTISRNYSNIWGFGFLDIDAALRSFGTVSTTSARIYDPGSGIELDDITISGGAAFGDSLALALSSSQIYVFDSLGAPFQSNLASYINNYDSRSAFIDWRYNFLQTQKLNTYQPHENVKTGIYQETYASGLQLGSEVTMKLGKDVSARFMTNKGVENSIGLSRVVHNFSNENSVIDNSKHNILGLADVSQSYGLMHNIGNTDFEIQFINGKMGIVEGIDSLNASGVEPAFVSNIKGSAFSMRSQLSKGTRFSLSLGQVNEDNSFLGSDLGDMLAISNGTDSVFGSVAISHDITPDITFSSVYHVSQSRLASSGENGLLTGTSKVTADSFALLLEGNAYLFGNQDLWSMFLSSPLKITHGNLSLRLPTHIDENNIISYETQSLALHTSARQYDLGFSYSIANTLLGNDSLKLGAMLSFNPGHSVTNKTQSQVMLGYDIKF